MRLINIQMNYSVLSGADKDYGSRRASEEVGEARSAVAGKMWLARSIRQMKIERKPVGGSEMSYEHTLGVRLSQERV
jgi:hypothetical protein